MLEIDIPSRPSLRLEHLVADYNGTLAADGVPVDGAIERLARLGEHLAIHVVTADTFGAAASYLARPFIHLHILEPGNQAASKAAFVERLGLESTVAIGNGYNDHLMLSRAALGVAVLQVEGAATATLIAADLAFGGILDALDALIDPRRIVASLRN